MAPKPKEDDTKIPCTSPAQLTAHIQDMQLLFSQPESEHNWEKFAKSLAKLAALVRGGAYKLDNFIVSIGPVSLGGVGDKIVACMLTERAGLSKFALELLTSLAPRLNSSFTGHLPRMFLPPLLELIRRTNNIIRERAENCLFKIVETCHLPLLLSYLTGGVKDSSVKLRKAVGSAMWVAVDQWEAGGRAGEVEMVVKALATDKDVEVRKVAKDLWEKYKETWPERVEDFSDPLTPTIRRRLDIKGTQQTATASSSLGPSRAKASKPKAYATFPPPPSSSTTSHSSLHESSAGRPRLLGLGSGPVRPVASHHESFASSSRQPLPPPVLPLLRSVTYSGHSDYPPPPSSSLSAFAVSSSHRAVSSRDQPFASTSAYPFPPPPLISHATSSISSNPIRNFDSSSSSSSSSSYRPLASTIAVSASTTATLPPPFLPRSTSSFRVGTSSFSSRAASESTSRRLGGKDLGMPVRGGEGGTRLGAAAMVDAVARKPKPRLGGISPVLLDIGGPTTPQASPAKQRQNTSSPQIADLIHSRVDGTELPDNLLMTDAPKSKVSLAKRVVIEKTLELEEVPVVVEPLVELVEEKGEEVDLVPSISPIREETTPAPESPSASVLPRDSSLPAEAPLIVVDDELKESEPALFLVPGLPTPPAEEEPVVLPEEEPPAEATPPAAVEPPVASAEDNPPSAAVVEEKVKQAEPVIVAPTEPLPPPPAPPAPAPAPVSKLSTSKAPVNPIGAPSKLIVRGAPTKTFRPVSSSSKFQAPNARPKPVVSAPSVRVLPPPKPSSIPPSAPAKARVASVTSKSAPVVASKPTPAVSKPVSVVTSRPPLAPQAIKRTIMKMKPAGPPPKVETEPRKRLTTKAPLPSFKPTSRIASGGPKPAGVGTVKGKAPVAAKKTGGEAAASAGGTLASTTQLAASDPKVSAVFEEIQTEGVVAPLPVEASKDQQPPRVDPSTLPLPASPPLTTPIALVPFPTIISTPLSLPADLDLAKLILASSSSRLRPKTTSLISSDGGAISTVCSSEAGDLTLDGSDVEDEEEGVKFNPLAQTLREDAARTAAAKAAREREEAKEDLIAWESPVGGVSKKTGSGGGGRKDFGKGVDSLSRAFGVVKEVNLMD